MKVLHALIKVAKFRLEQAEQKRSFVSGRIDRLRQSRQIVEADLRELQQRHAQSLQDMGTLPAHCLLGMRQIWCEAQERQKLMTSMDEQLGVLLREKEDLDRAVHEAWSRKASLDRALELQALLRRERLARDEWMQADESWSQMLATRRRGAHP